MDMTQATVIGTGAWGTAFARILADAGMSVVMLGRNRSVIEAINSGMNPDFLPNVTLSNRIHATDDPECALNGSSLVALAVPVAAIRQIVATATPFMEKNAAYLTLAKGIDARSLHTVHQIVCEESGLPASHIAALSGPNLSREIAQRQPAATVIACEDTERASRIAIAIHTPYFRPYVASDVMGCEIAGAVKNVIALSIGASEGLGYGSNTRATLITRGLAEMTRLGTAMGADPATFAGLAGIGDLVATCSSRLSRNYLLGMRMGEGMDLERALELSAGVVEGVRSAGPIHALAKRYQVEMPITEGVVRVVSGELTPVQMGEMLLSRPQKMDGWRIELL